MEKLQLYKELNQVTKKDVNNAKWHYKFRMSLLLFYMVLFFTLIALKVDTNTYWWFTLPFLHILSELFEKIVNDKYEEKIKSIYEQLNN